MANLSSEQEAMDRAHKENGSTCLPNCNRHHYGDPVHERLHECNWCDRMLSDDKDAQIEHNEWHMTHPESITK